MHEFTMQDQEHRLFEMSSGFIAIKDRAVNMNDLTSLKPGGIVRCRENPEDCIKVFYGDDTAIGCVAGWMSEPEPAVVEYHPV